MCALTAGPGRDQRDERDRLRAGEPLAAGRARRARAGDALGAGLAAGDRPRAVRARRCPSSRRRRSRPRRSRGSSTRRSRRALAPHCGPAFVDFPLDYVFMEAPSRRRRGRPHAAPCAARRRRESSGPPRCCAGAERPVIMAGTDLYWGHGEDALRALAEALRIPVFLNGLARGCVPADHELFFSRARSHGAEGRRRRARDRRADGLPARLRRRRSARTPRSS